MVEKPSQYTHEYAPTPSMVNFRPFSGVGVGWQRRCEIRLELRELDKQCAAFFSFEGLRLRYCFLLLLMHRLAV